MKSRVFALALAVLMVVMMLTACTSAPSSTTAPAAASTGTTTTPTQAAESNFNATGLPIVKEPITLKICAGHNMTTKPFAELPIFQRLEKDTNIKIEWDLVEGDWSEKKTLMFASNELPDVFLSALGDSDLMANLDRFVALEDYIKQYAPNIQKILDTDDSAKKTVTAPDGHIYSTPQRMPNRPMTTLAAMINKQWLDKLQLKVPTTPDELYTVLKAFKTGDPNSNGQADEIPLCYINGIIGGYLQSLFGAWGIVSVDKFQVKDGKVQYIPMQDGYKQAMTYFSKLYQEGLIDPESVTSERDWSIYLGKLQKNPAVVGLCFGWSYDVIGADIVDQYVPMPALTGPDGQRGWGQEPVALVYGRNQLLVTNSNKNIEATVRLADEFFTPENSLELFYGPFGTSITKNSDGKIERLPAPEGMSGDEWSWKWGMNDGAPCYISADAEKNIIPSKMETWKLDLDAFYKPFTWKEYFPSLFLSKADSDEVAAIKVDVEKYAKEKAAEWLVKGGIDAQWDDYINQLNKMNVARMVEIYQKAYEKYIAS